MLTAADSLVRNDSLHRAVEAMFLRGAHLTPAQVADSLPSVPPTTAADLFGAGSTVAEQAAGSAAPLLLTENPLFQSLILVLATVYALFVYRYMGNIYTLFLRTWDNTSGDRVFEQHNASSDAQFLNFMGAVGLLAAGIFCVKGADLMLPAGALPYGAAAGIALLAAASILFTIFAQICLLLLIGAVTLTQGFIHELVYIKRTMLALTAILTIPVVIFYVPSPLSAGRVWAYILLAEMLTITFFFLWRTFALFLSKKISILHWFLYLCTVELLPISLLWLLIARQ